MHLAQEIPIDYDVIVFRTQGQALLDGHYPRSEYPTGAVSLFAFETWIGGGSARTANAWLMIPFQLATVGAIWSLRTRWSAWLAALVALWPLDAYAWEFKFDLVPAALLAVGLALAYRERFGLAGVALGIGAAVKWTPALATLALVVWLLSSQRGREAVRHAAGFLAAFVVLTLPYLVWDPRHVLDCVLDPGRSHDHRRVLWYLPLHWLGQAQLGDDFTQAASVPGWADPAATVLQLAIVAGVLVLAVRVRGALAAASPSPRSPPSPSCSRTVSSARSSSSRCLRAGLSRRRSSRAARESSVARRRGSGRDQQRVRLPVRPAGRLADVGNVLDAALPRRTGAHVLAARGSCDRRADRRVR